mgnify:CR=1 FL=1
MRKILCIVATVAAAAACSHDRTYPERHFTWSGDIASGATAKIRNVDGGIAILASADNKLTVDAVIVNAAPSAVSVKLAMQGTDVLFCTDIASRKSSACNDAGVHVTTFAPWKLFSRSHPITVRYTMHVPAGVKVDVETVNGSVAAQNIAASVKAATMNGNVSISTTNGTVNAETVNGSIVASMAQLPDSGNVHLETVNGSITSVIPEGIGGRINLENVNGAITASYPNAVPDSGDKPHMPLQLARGALRVHLETGNASGTTTRYCTSAPLPAAPPPATT